jgi:hypothetical protein
LARTATPDPRGAAQGFVDHLNSVLNRTVSDARLSVIPLPHDPAAFEITRMVEREAVALNLLGSALRVFVSQTITVVEGHCRTESYAYRLQRDDSRQSWLIRWEYLRDPPRPDYAYPPAHVHVNGAWQRDEALDHLHIPTRRIPLELVIWHLLAEWGVPPRSDDWQAILRESIEGFDERRTAH